MTTDHQTTTYRTAFFLPDAEATEAFGQALAGRLRAGDTLCLSGQIGAGKSHLARAAIRCLLTAADAPAEDIPSPTYTLVQTYLAGETEIWHADLYRLTDPSEVFELGLEEVFSEAICLVEWPDRLGEYTPPDALEVTLKAAGEGRLVEISGLAESWASRLDDLTEFREAADDPAR